MESMCKKLPGYEVGALLYAPALNSKLAEKVIDGQFGSNYSLAICLEDTISDNVLSYAEDKVVDTISRICRGADHKDMYLPKIFVRVRDAKQLIRIDKKLSECSDVVKGYVFPKYTKKNADEFNEGIIKINQSSQNKKYMMPVLESADIANYSMRMDNLCGIKEKLDELSEYVLNIRVGGNDLSNVYSVRRHYDETIYDILPIAHILSDIITIFSKKYVVSGPVWEYFSSDNNEWKTGLEKEVKMDKINGFVGKTVIHPKQISIVNEAFKVSHKDYEDAKCILNWNDQDLLVKRSWSGERMNEKKTHYQWALKIIALAEIYGTL